MTRSRSTRVAAVLLALSLVAGCSHDDGAAPASDDPTTPVDLGPEQEEYALPEEDLDGGAESGRVVFHGTLSSRHLHTVPTAGGASTVVELDGYEGVGAPTVSPDGETLAALGWAPGATELATTLLVGTLDAGLEPILEDPDLDMWCVRWYPAGDGLLLTAFVADDMSPALLSVRLDGSISSVEVPPGRFDCAVPLDHHRIALTYLGMDVALVGLALVDTATGEADVLFEKEGCLLYGGSLSPTGDELAVSAACEEPGASGLHVVDLDTGAVDHVLVGELGFPAWSPSAEWFAVGAFATPSVTSSTVWIVRRDGTGARQLTGERGTQPAWVR